MFQTTNQEFYSAFSSICQHNTYHTHSSNQVPQWSPRGKWRRPFRPSGVLQKDVDGFVGDGQEERIRIRRGGRNLHRATWRCETFRMESQMYVGLRWVYYGYILLYSYIYIYIYLYDWNMDICIYIYIIIYIYINYDDLGHIMEILFMGWSWVYGLKWIDYL